MLTVVNMESKRECFAKADKDLLDRMIVLHADVCEDIDLHLEIYSVRDENYEMLVQYESVAADAIKRLKQLSPYL